MNVLLTSVGRRSYMVKYFKEALEGGKVICCNADKLTTAMNIADKSYISPLIYSDEYIGFLLDICKKENIDFIISLFDIDIKVLAKHREIFESNGIKLIVSDFDITRICNDKWEMYQYLIGKGLNSPKTFLNYNDMEIDNLLKIGKKFIIKPRWGMGSLGVYEADTKEEIGVFYNKTKKDIINTYLKYEAKEDIDKCVIIQEKLIGKEYGLDIINDLNKNYICTIAKEKLAMRAGETDIAKVINDARLESLGKRVSNSLKHIANMDMDVIIQDDKEYIIDLNARFGGGYPFSHEAGVNLVKAIACWIVGEDKVDLRIKQYGIYAKNLEMVKLS